ncbi:hypothetical protein K457DRAFT_423310 [Linnemannia elongata AG-77]|uniref:Uncharacterized protein n=1 Tax=Linnemannia elongata AG-77 TaxID=1314771 RepID=A0A197K0N1_9FUNG|nr:hypothetical protein K457DRAFT_423310 [Linnemannia elongata AG-77]
MAIALTGQQHTHPPTVDSTDAPFSSNVLTCLAVHIQTHISHTHTHTHTHLTLLHTHLSLTLSSHSLLSLSLCFYFTSCSIDNGVSLLYYLFCLPLRERLGKSFSNGDVVGVIWGLGRVMPAPPDLDPCLGGMSGE